MRGDVCLKCASRLVQCSLAAVIISFLALWQALYHSPLLSTDASVLQTDKKAIYRGVNLGGWLLVEPWITPSLFYPFLCKAEGCPPDKPPVIDEQSLCKRLGSSAARQVLEKHRSTWVTEHTFQRLAASGVNLVRIPFGYWLFGDVPDFCFGVNSVHHLDNAVNWAGKHNVQVLLDLHGVVGGANGLDNSGVSYVHPYAAQWGRPPFDGAAWLQPPKLNMTRAFLRRIVARYSGRQAVVRIGMVNEADISTIPFSELFQYYEDTWQNLSDVLSPGQEPVLDLGIPWAPFSSPPKRLEGLPPVPVNLKNGVMDWHVYNFMVGLWKPQVFHFRRTCDVAGKLRKLHEQVLPTMVGEWSLGMTYCMTWFKGVGIPAWGGVPCQRVPCPTTYNNVTAGTSDPGGPDEKGLCPLGPPPEERGPPGPLEPEEFFKLLAAYYLSAYGSSAGWIFWNFQTEIRNPRWSFFDAQDRGWFPSNFSSKDWRPIVLPCERRDSFLGNFAFVALTCILCTLILLCMTCVWMCCGCCLMCRRCIMKRCAASERGQYVEMLDAE